MTKLSSQLAFSLLELVIVIVVLSILGAIVIPRIGTIDEDARTRAAYGEMVELQKAIMGDKDFRGYRSDVGALPTALTDLLAAQSGSYNPFIQSQSRGDYISEADTDSSGTADILEDPWGTDYQWNSATGVITSHGPDQGSGGGDDITLDVDG